MCTLLLSGTLLYLVSLSEWDWFGWQCFHFIAGEEGNESTMRSVVESFKKSARNCCTLKTLRRRIPITEWLPKYRLDLFVQDLIAGKKGFYTCIIMSASWEWFVSLTRFRVRWLVRGASCQYLSLLHFKSLHIADCLTNLTTLPIGVEIYFRNVVCKIGNYFHYKFWNAGRMHGEKTRHWFFRTKNEVS